MANKPTSETESNTDQRAAPVPVRLEYQSGFDQRRSAFGDWMWMGIGFAVGVVSFACVGGILVGSGGSVREEWPARVLIVAIFGSVVAGATYMAVRTLREKQPVAPHTARFGTGILLGAAATAFVAGLSLAIS